MTIAGTPFTDEHLAEWASFGPRIKGKPTPDQLQNAQDRKAKCTEMRKRLAALPEFEGWAEKKIEKELDQLVEAAGSGTGTAASTSTIQTLDPPSGTRDFYPPEMRIRNWLFGNFRKVAVSFGFEEYDAPVLEHVELY